MKKNDMMDAARHWAPLANPKSFLEDFRAAKKAIMEPTIGGPISLMCPICCEVVIEFRLYDHIKSHTIGPVPPKPQYTSLLLLTNWAK